MLDIWPFRAAPVEVVPPIVHIFLDCLSSHDAFVDLNVRVKEVVQRSGAIEGAYETYLTYVVAKGGDQVDFARAFDIAEEINTHTCARRIILPQRDVAFASIVIAHEVGKCVVTAREWDVVFVASDDERILQAAMIAGTPLVKMLMFSPAGILKVGSEFNDRRPSASPEGHVPSTSALLSTAPSLPVPEPPPHPSSPPHRNREAIQDGGHRSRSLSTEGRDEEAAPQPLDA